ncbi:MAG TPA: hypothetical protein VKT82_26160 [Ktedonobacterales bacterium]|nr:hypothetical protein [Ktedonobacterales bacterium]
MNRRSAFFKSAVLRWITLLALGLLLSAMLGACSPGHTGGNEIAFLRGGNLWEIDQDGSNLHQVATNQILGFSWSPDHQQIVLRMSNGKTPADALPYGYPDLTSELGVTSVDGGNIIQITPPNSGLWRSDAWWDASGNRLLYREEKSGTDGQLETPHWELSQSDQPAGIARKDLPASAVLPAVNSDGSQIASIDASGRVLVGAPGSPATVIATGAVTMLPGTPGYPARPLWQPNTGSLLYAFASAGPTPDVTTLVLRNSSGKVQPLVTAANIQQYAWSPDGRELLVRTASEYQLYSASGAERFSWSDANAISLPFWSPDSRVLLILEPDNATLVNVVTQQRQQLLSGTITLPTPFADAHLAPFLRPATSSPWNSDSSAVLLSNDGQGTWATQPDTPLPTGKGGGSGLYLVTLAQPNSVPQFPTLVDWGDHQSIAWTTLDPNCAFLIV